MQVKQHDLLQDYLCNLLQEVSIDKPIDKTAINNVKQATSDSSKLEQIFQAEIDRHAIENLSDLPPTPFKPDLLWRESRFQALVFNVHELHLAAPLTMLNRVQVLEKLTPINSTGGMFLGLMTSALGQQVQVVDTLKLIMPKMALAHKNNYTHVVVAEGKNWGLAVNGIEDSISLAPEDVQWRSVNNKRPWFAGVVINSMHGLLDLYYLDKILTD